MDGRRLVFPPIVSISVAAGVWRIYKAIFPLTTVHLIAAGTIMGTFTLSISLQFHFLPKDRPTFEEITPFYRSRRSNIISLYNRISSICFTGYLCYDLMHYYMHNGAPKVGSYLYTMKRRHNYHHFLHHDQGDCRK